MLIVWVAGLEDVFNVLKQIQGPAKTPFDRIRRSWPCLTRAKRRTYDPAGAGQHEIVEPGSITDAPAQTPEGCGGSGVFAGLDAGGLHRHREQI